MDGNQQEPEPLLGDDDYELLRCDSLLARVGSNNFASLLEISTPPTIENEEFNQVEMQPPLQYQPQTQQEVAAGIQVMINNPLPMENDIILPSDELQWDQAENWLKLEDAVSTV